MKAIGGGAMIFIVFSYRNLMKNGKVDDTRRILLCNFYLK